MSEHHLKEPETHSPIGASTCERWWNCPGSVKLAEGLPPQPPSVFAATGTVAHTVASTYLEGLKTLKMNGWEPYEVSNFKHLVDFIGEEYEEDGFKITVDEEMVEAVQVYVDEIEHLLQEYSIPWRDVQIERKFQLKHLDPEAYGTADFAIFVPYWGIIIIDYKHGAGKVVEVENNFQQRYYALGVYYDLPEALRGEVAYVVNIVVQPRARHIDGQVRTHKYHVRDLLQHENELRAAIGRVRSADASLKAGDHCLFCPAKIVCPEITKAFERDLETSFSAVGSAPLRLPSVDGLTPERLGFLLKNANLLREWISEIISRATQLAEKGQKITGYKLVNRLGNRKWIDEKKVIKEFSDVDDEDLYAPRKVKSPAQLERLGKEFKARVEALTERKLGAGTLVEEDDPRAERTPEAQFEEYKR